LEDTQTIQHAHLLGKPGIGLWNKGMLHELDFEGMRDMPGRQPLRYAKPPPEVGKVPRKVTWKSLMDKREEKGPEKKANLVEAMKLGERNRAKQKAEMEEEKIKNKGASADTAMPEEYRALCHPVFVDMEKPHFNFIAESQRNEYQEFIWQRRLEDCEDTPELIYELGCIYREILEADQTVSRCEIPMIAGGPTIVLAALSIAMYMAGARRCPDAPKCWRFSSSAEFKHWPPSKRKDIFRKSTKTSSTPERTGQQSASSSRRPSSSGAIHRPRPNGKLEVLKGSASTPALGKQPDARYPADIGHDRPSTAPSSTGSVGSAFLRQMAALKAAGVGAKLVPTTPKKVTPPGSHRYMTFVMTDTSHNRGLSLRFIQAFEEWQACGAKINALGVQGIEKQDGGYKWFTIVNDPETRLKRMGLAALSMWEAVEMSTNSFESRVSDRVQMQSALRVRASVGGGGGNDFFNVRAAPNMSAFDSAIDQRRRFGKRSAATVLCAVDVVGGGFFAGHTVFLEEEAQMRSDLYNYLHEAGAVAAHLKLTDSRGRVKHLPDDGVLECRDVKVFREGWERGFQPLDKPVQLDAVFCYGIVNLNPYNSPTAESRVELANMDKDRYVAQLRVKFDMLLWAACEADIEVLCVSDQGAQRQHNRGKDLGLALGGAMQRCQADLQSLQILLGGSSDFISNVKKALSKDPL